MPSRELPAYYTGLSSFRDVFAQGNPVLTYHKLGRRPTGVRLKGLYVSSGLFETQLNQLRRAGYQSGSLAQCAGPIVPRQVVLTFDDGYVNVLREGVELLARNRFKAIQFLPAKLLGKCNEWDVALGEAAEPIMDATQVRDWLAAGHEIGSHTLTHPYLTQLPVDQAREEIGASRKLLQDMFGLPIEHFCYPFGDWNPAMRELVAAAGYQTACTTEPGVNGPREDRFTLKRFTARYRSRNWRGFWSWMTGR